MRTTLNLDEDVLDLARSVAEKSGKPFKVVVNHALRLGLDEVEEVTKKKPYRTHSHKMKLRRQYSLDNIQELLAEIEGEDFR